MMSQTAIITVRLGPHAYQRLDERAGPIPSYGKTVELLNQRCGDVVWVTDTASGARRLHVVELGGTFVLAQEDDEPVWFTKTFMTDTMPDGGQDVEVRWIELEGVE